jgi:hypothetical protein
MVTGWKASLSVSKNAAHRCATDESLRRAYGSLREAICRVVEAARPKTMACPGAGVLNDIPYRTLVQSDTTVHLVDWLTDLVETGAVKAGAGWIQIRSSRGLKIRGGMGGCFSGGIGGGTISMLRSPHS